MATYSYSLPIHEEGTAIRQAWPPITGPGSARLSMREGLLAPGCVVPSLCLPPPSHHDAHRHETVECLRGSGMWRVVAYTSVSHPDTAAGPRRNFTVLPWRSHLNRVLPSERYQVNYPRWHRREEMNLLQKQLLKPTNHVSLGPTRLSIL
jgi:hypothetical protein